MSEHFGPFSGSLFFGELKESLLGAAVNPFKERIGPPVFVASCWKSQCPFKTMEGPIR